MNKTIFIDFHIHSKYSFDSWMSPQKILDKVKKKGLGGIAITDHNTIEGALEAQRLNRDPEIRVIIGEEVKTEMGEIIGIFLKDKVHGKNSREVVDEIHSQGGLVILPHPYKYKSPFLSNKSILGKVDFIETFNSRCSGRQNRKAQELARKLNKPGVGGSDGHFFQEIGSAKTEVTDSFFDRVPSPKIVISVKGKKSPFYFEVFSQLIKRIKKLRRIFQIGY